MEIKLKGDELKNELSNRELIPTGIKPTQVKMLDSPVCNESAPVGNFHSQIQKRERESPGDEDCSDDLRKLRKNKELHKQECVCGASSSRSNKSVTEKLYEDSQKSKVEENEEEEDTKKGSVVLDEYIPDEVKSKYHVLQQGDAIYDAKLNLTDVEGKNNEFYIIQALESNDGSTFMVYSRWGRVGMKGQDKLHDPHTCVQSAIKEFKRKLHEKAKNYFWSWYKQFVPDTKLDERTAKFVSLICNASMREEQKISTGYDAENLPLGKLSKAMSSEVESLGEVEVASELLENACWMEEEDPLFSIYQLLHCELIPVEVDSKEFHMINKYMKNTHAKTHSNYTAEIVQIFRISKDGEADNFSKFSDIKNRMLLWHGSQLTNWFGILSEGLRIAPPEASVTGYMFGKGVYFADMFSKSARYSQEPQQANSDGVLLLCEVALGEMAELLRANNHADNLPPGKLSTKGVGASGPDMLENETLEDGVVVPLGHPIKQLPSKVSLLYNEFVVYNVNQIMMRYVVHVKFIFKDAAEKEAALYRYAF